MRGRSPAVYTDPETAVLLAQKKIQDAEETLGFPVPIDRVRYEPGLDAVAETKVQGREIEVAFSDEWLLEPQYEKDWTVIHELDHVWGAAGKRKDALDYFGFDDSFVESIDGSIYTREEEETEAYAELITENLMEDLYGRNLPLKGGYPSLKRQKEIELESRNIETDQELEIEGMLEPESELVEEIDEEIERLRNHYTEREIYGAVETPNIYREYGEIDGKMYEAVYLGPAADAIGEKIVGEHLDNRSFRNSNYEGGDPRDGEPVQLIPEDRREASVEYSSVFDEYDAPYGQGKNGFDNQEGPVQDTPDSYTAGV